MRPCCGLIDDWKASTLRRGPLVAVELFLLEPETTASGGAGVTFALEGPDVE
jgi:hypothetical protein